MSRRPKRDPEGRRRASVERGRGKPRNQTQGGKPPKPPRRGGSRAPDHRTVWQRQADRSRRLVGYGAKHKAGLLGWAGILGALTCMWVFTGTTQLLTVGVSLAAAGGGAALRHHQRNRTMNSSTSRRASAADVKAHHDAMLFGARPGGRDGTETVRSHTNDGHGVREYVRRKPGAAA